MLFLMYDPEVAHQAIKIPRKYRRFGCFSLLFWNATCVENIHNDIQDYTWCVIIPFRNFICADLECLFVNTLIKINRKDICILRSKEMWHTVSNVLEDQ